jgi:hypothetical protein
VKNQRFSVSSTLPLPQDNTEMSKRYVYTSNTALRTFRLRKLLLAPSLLLPLLLPPSQPLDRMPHRRMSLNVLVLLSLFGRSVRVRARFEEGTYV